MEGLKKVLDTFPPNLPYVLYLWSQDNLLAFTEVCGKQEPHLSPFFYLILTLTSLEDENEATLKNMKRIMFNPVAYQQEVTPPFVPEPLVEHLVVYMDNFFDNCPWIFLYETKEDHYGRAGTKWPEFQGENCPLITFLGMLAERLLRVPPFFNIKVFEEEDDITLSSVPQIEMQKWMLEWLNSPNEDDVGLEEAMGEAMEVEPSGESLGSEDSIDEDEEEEDEDEDSKGKEEL
jgi:hypothetical protein